MEPDSKQSFGRFELWKKTILIVVFFTITPIALITSFISISALSKDKQQDVATLEVDSLINFPKSGVQVYASLPSEFPSISGKVEYDDARKGLIKQYLINNNSPLADYSNQIVDTADQYGLDYRLITAIAQKESGLCKVIPENSYNCWGWGIHSKGSLGFDNYSEGIETVSKGIKDNYIDKGYLTLEEIMSKYTPLSNGSWAEGVSFYMDQI